MKRNIILLIVAAVLFGAACQKKEVPIALDNQEKKQSYFFGWNFGQQLKTQEDSIDLDAFFAGIRDQYTGAPQKLTDEEFKRVMEVYQAAQQRKMAAKTQEMEQQGIANKAEEEAFLKENAVKEGVKTTASGLQYKVLTPGTGESPKATDKVKVHYRGTFSNGTEFDSSYKNNTPVEFPLNGVITGWTEGLQLMKVGAKFQFFIPYRLAYGEQGRPPAIPPAKLLIFEVELLEIVK